MSENSLSGHANIPSLPSPEEEAVILRTLAAVADAWVVIRCDAALHILSASDSLRALLGEMPQTAAPFLRQGHLLRLRADYVRSPGPGFDQELEVTGKNGALRRVRLRGLYFGTQKDLRLYLAIYDLTEGNQQEMQAQLNSYREMADRLNSTVYLYDFETDTMCIYGDRSTVWQGESVVLRFLTGREALSPRRRLFRETLRGILCDRQDIEKRLMLMPVSETEDRWKSVTALSLWDDGRRKRRICFVEDRQEEITEKKDLTRRAWVDRLTGLPNRASCEEYISLKLRRGSGSCRGTMLFLDLDGFKQVNDLLGHTQGDEALRAAAEAVRTCFRGQDQVFRIGGDEFVAWMDVCADEQMIQDKILRLNEKLLECVQRRGLQTLSISAGAAHAMAGDTFEQLYRRADNAMYEAKHSGKGRCFFSDSSGETVVYAAFGAGESFRNYEEMPNGVAVLRALRGADSQPADYEVIYLNPAFRAMCGEQMAERLCGAPLFRDSPELGGLLGDSLLATLQRGEPRELCYFSPGFGRLVCVELTLDNSGCVVFTVRGQNPDQTALPGFSGGSEGVE